ncbi:MAG: alanine--tRNA ligase [Verrucomicrobiales bacterium]
MSVLTSSEIRQSFLDFFEEKLHTIVPSSSVMPTSPNLMFTNAGMNQFVPYFLGTEAAPYDPPRAADTQKCIRAGGKHNDLDDVGYDTYHHTLFEMLGNWSFGNYFKTEAIEWAWELLTERWKLPPERLYATVYKPGKGDPANFDQVAYDIWKAIFEKAGLDPDVHIVNGNKADNFWMMGDTGPCGPCSEVHVDLTPLGDTKGSLVNMDDSRCIEIWNLVFIQFNADGDGGFRPLPATHVDTGMGFERVVSIIQCTDGLKDFSTLASNYDTDVFSPIFEKLSEMCGQKYTSTVPEGGKRQGLSEQEQIDIAFRVIGDHLRTTSISIADGIEPGNGKRNYVIRNILRRAVRFGRILGFSADNPFLEKLAPTLIAQLGDVFPELKKREERILSVLAAEETLFNKTLDRGLVLFDRAVEKLGDEKKFPPATVVKLWETYGFPTDLTELLLDERGLKTDSEELEKLVAEHKATGAKGQSSQKISAVTIETDVVSEFVGFDNDETETEIAEWIEEGGNVFAIIKRSPLYVEKGGQLGDTGELQLGDEIIPIVGTTTVGEALVIQVEEKPESDAMTATIRIAEDRRRGIESHHTATHLFHWALHNVVSKDATQQGSLVTPDRLRFDFNSDALTAEQIAETEKQVNECILKNDPVSWIEVPHADVKENPGVMQFFGDKYGDLVRVVQIGGEREKLDGYSMELCGGTHVRNTGEIGFFKIRSEGAIAAGIRRIEAVCGDAAVDFLRETEDETATEIETLTDKLTTANTALVAAGADPISGPNPIADNIDTHLNDGNHRAASDFVDSLKQFRDELKTAAVDAEKSLKKAAAGAAAKQASEWLETILADSPTRIAEQIPGDNANLLQEAMNGLKNRGFEGVAALVLVADGTIHVGSLVHKSLIEDFKAGDLVREITAVAGGKGGGKPEMARGAARDLDKLDDVLAKAKELVG